MAGKPEHNDAVHISLTDISAGLYLDANCIQPGGGGTTGLIAGYQIFSQLINRGDPAPSSNNAAEWTPVGAPIPLGAPGTATVACAQDADRDLYVTTGVVFDSGFSNSWVSGNSTRIECGANLAEPEDVIERKPRNREKPRSRSRGR